jgi:signal transduction histidine kinase
VFTAEVRSVFVAQFQAIWDGRAGIEVEQRAAALHGRQYDSILSWQARLTSTGPDYSSVLVAIWDITALSAAKREIEQLSVARQDLIDHVSHSLRRPLNTVLRYAQSMQAAPLEADNRVERREIVDALAENAQELATYIEALFIQARLNAGSLHVASFDVDVTAQLMQVTEQLTETKKPTIYKGGRCVAVGDPQHVRHIIQNLLTVATRRSSSTADASISVERDSILFDVVDDGLEDLMSGASELFDALDVVGEPDSDPAIAELKTRLSVSRALARTMGGNVIFDRVDGRSALRMVLARASG